MKSTSNNIQRCGLPIPIPTNRELTLSLIGSIFRFTIDVPQVFLRREEITPDKLLFLLLPIVRNLGKLIDRIRHSARAGAGGASNVSGHIPSACATVHYSARKTPANVRSLSRRNDDADDNEAPKAATATGGHSMSSGVKKTFTRNRHPLRQHGGSMSSLLMSDDDEGSNMVFKVGPGGCKNNLVVTNRQVFLQRDGNYAIRETTDKRNVDGSIQRNTRTISGPDITILTNVTSQLSELPSLMVELSK